MAKEVNINLKGLTALVKDMPKLTLTLEKQIALKTPSEIVKNIGNGKTGIFPSSSLPQNEASTQAQKSSRGNGTKPLIDYKKLTNSNTWRVVKETGGYVVKVPKDREDAAYNLHNGLKNGKQYKFMEIPNGFFPDFAAILKTSFFNKKIKLYN